MNQGETNTPDSRVVGAYRTASGVLDERPKEETRAAILAAAARAVDAQPRDAQTGAVARRAEQRKRLGSRGPSKRPLALVASFLVAAIAVGLATRTTQHQATSETAVAETARVEDKTVQLEAMNKPTNQMNQDKDADSRRDAGEEKSSVAAATPEVKREAAPLSSNAAKPPAKQRMPAPESPAAPASKPEQQIQQGAPMDALASAGSRVMRAESAPNRAAAPAASPPAALAVPAPPQAEERAKEIDKQQVVAEQADSHTSAADANVSAQGRLAKAKPVERTAAIAGDSAPDASIENDPARWMERIIALRDAGRDADADRELARLRARYPDMKVPPNALARSGTR